MKKLICILIILSMSIMLLASCNAPDTPDVGGNTDNGGENNNGNGTVNPDDSGTVTPPDGSGNTPSEGEGDATVTLRYKTVEYNSDIPIFPSSDAPEYYYCADNQKIYKLFYTYEDVAAFVDALHKRNMKLGTQCINFSIVSEDYMPLWIFIGMLTPEQLSTLAADNKPLEELEYYYESFPGRSVGIDLCPTLIYRDATKHTDGKITSALCGYAWEDRDVRASLLDVTGYDHTAVEEAKKDPYFGSAYADIAVLPSDFTREGLSYTVDIENGKTNRYYLWYNDMKFAWIVSCEVLTEEFINSLFDSINVLQ